MVKGKVKASLVSKRDKGSQASATWTYLIWFFGLGVLLLSIILTQQSLFSRTDEVLSNDIQPNNVKGVMTEDLYPGVPTYDEYVKLAKKNKWNPFDPKAKIEDILRRYPQAYDLSQYDPEGTSNEFRYIKMFQEEIKFLLKVIEKSPSKQVDLSTAFQLAIDLVNSCIFRTMKHVLANSDVKIITRDKVLNSITSWVFNPLKELLALNKKQLPHINLDLKAFFPGSQYDSFDKAVQYRLYILFKELLDVAPRNLNKALHIAIINGDDLAVALILRFQENLLSTNSRKSNKLLNSGNLISHIENAERLGYFHIALRLVQFLSIHTLDNSLPNEESLAMVNQTRDIVSQYLIDYPSKWNQTIPLKNEFVSFKHSNIPKQNDSLLTCDIPIISFLDMNLTSEEFIERFFYNFVRLNRPVLLKFSPETTREWLNILNRNNLLDIFSQEQVLVSHIPYAKLFGDHETYMTLQKFADYSNNISIEFSSLFKSDYSSIRNIGKVFNHSLEILRKSVSTFLPKLNDSFEEEKFLDTINGAFYLFQNKQLNFTNKISNKFLRKIMKLKLKDIDEIGFSLDDIANIVAQQNFTPLKDIQAEKSYQFFFGPKGSGAPWHSHAPALNIILSGAKYWQLTPPGRDLYTTIHPLQWLGENWTLNPNEFPYYVDQHSESPANTLCDFMQHEGEILFVPRHWSHQVLNVEETLGFAVEISNYVH